MSSRIVFTTNVQVVFAREYVGRMLNKCDAAHAEANSASESGMLHPGNKRYEEVTVAEADQSRFRASPFCYSIPKELDQPLVQ